MELIFGCIPHFVFSGSGSGCGSGYGSGSGYGCGSGYGYGDGYGSGYGDGYGYGYGDGSGPYWLATIEGFALKWPLTQQERLASLQAAGAKIAFWRSDAAGRPANGGRGVVAAPGVVHREKGPLNLFERGTLHATLIPPAWKGERWWVVALIGEVVGDDKKMGALEREILGECL